MIYERCGLGSDPVHFGDQACVIGSFVGILFKHKVLAKAWSLIKD
jgi:hypothetical protein